jgi:YesN/AraC family two-component response regulator
MAQRQRTLNKMKTVLIVDDELELLRTIAEYLEAAQSDFQILTANNGLEALESLRNQHVSLVVTDIRMPEMTGLDLIAIMLEEFPTIPCLVFSAYGTPELESYLKQVGSIGFIEKPFDPEILLRRIQDGLENLDETGSLSAIPLDAFLQVLQYEKQSAIVEITHRETAQLGYVYMSQGELHDAVWEKWNGESAFFKILHLPKSDIGIRVHIKQFNRPKTIQAPLMQLVLEAMRLLDEENERKKTNSSERSFMMSKRSTTDIFSEMLEIPGMMAVIVIAKDGFLIESAGSAKNVNLDGLGASLALVFNGVEQMGSDLSLQTFNTLTIEYGDALIVCQPVGEAFLAMLGPDSKTLGAIRFKSKRYVDELADYF